MTPWRANWMVGVLLVLVLGFLAGTALVAIGESLEQAYDQGYRDGAAGVEYRMPSFGSLAP